MSGGHAPDMAALTDCRPYVLCLLGGAHGAPYIRSRLSALDGLEQIFRGDIAHRAALALGAARLRLMQDMTLHLADDVHLAGFAVELQGQYFVLMDQLHILDFGAHA